MILSCLLHWSVIKSCKSVNLTVVAFIHNCARFFVEIASELYYFRLKMVKQKKISVEKRTQIIILQKTGKNYWEIAKILNISLCSVHTAIRRYRETGQNTNRKRSGRPRKTNERIDKKIYAICKGNRQKSALEIVYCANCKTWRWLSNGLRLFQPRWRWST